MPVIEEVAIALTAQTDKFVKDTNKAVDGVTTNATSKFGALGAKIAVAFGGAVVGGALGALGSSFKELDTTMAGVSARAGLTAEQTDKLTDSVISLSKANLQSQTEIAGTSEALISLQGIALEDADEIERLTQRYLDFSLVTGQTAPDAVAAFDDILDAWNLTSRDGVEIMDQLIVSHQKFGTDIVGAQAALNKYASTFQTLGLDVNDALGYVNLFAASGIDAESSAAAFNKAVGLLTDNTEASNTKLAQMVTNLGLTDDELAAFAASDPAGKFDILTKAIAGVEDPALRAQIAIDLFGAKAGPKLAEALAGSNLDDFQVSIEDAAGASEEAANKIENTITNKLKLLGKQIKGRAMELTQDFAPALIAFGQLGPKAGAAIGALIPMLGSLFVAQTSATAGQTGLNTAMAINPVGLIIIAIAAVVAALVVLELKTKFFSEKALPALKDAWDSILPVLENVADWVTDKLAPALQKLGQNVIEKYLIPAVQTLAQGWDRLAPLLRAVTDRFIQDILPAVISVAKVIGGTLWPLLKNVGEWLAEHKLVLIAFAAVVLTLVAPWVAVAAAIVIVLAHWDDIKAFFENTIQKITDLIDKFSEIPIIGEIFQAAFDSVVTIATAFFKTAQAVIQTQIDLIKGIFKIALALIHGDFGLAFDELIKLVGVLFEDLKTLAGIQLGLIRDLFWIAVQGFVGVISDGALLMLDAGKALLTGLYNGVKAYWDDVLYFYFIGFPLLILTTLGDLTLTLLQLGKDLIKGLWEGVGIAWEIGKTFLTELPGKIVEGIGDVSETLLGVGKSLLGGLLSGAKAMFELTGSATESVLGWFSQIPTRLLNIFYSLAKMPLEILYEVGKQVMEGLKDGMVWGWDNVVKPWLSFIKILIPRFKGPPSEDAKLLYDNGQLILQGLIDGLESRKANLIAALADLSQQIIDSLDPERTGALEEIVAGFRTAIEAIDAEIRDLVASLPGYEMPGIIMEPFEPTPIGGINPPTLPPPAKPTAPGAIGSTPVGTIADTVLGRNSTYAQNIANALGTTSTKVRAMDVGEVIAKLNLIGSQTELARRAVASTNSTVWWSFMDALRAEGLTFDQGGWLPEGVSLAVNNSGAPEPVIPPNSREYAMVMASRNGDSFDIGGGGVGGNGAFYNWGRVVNVFGPGRQSRDVLRDLGKILNA